MKVISNKYEKLINKKIKYLIYFLGFLKFYIF